MLGLRLKMCLYDGEVRREKWRAVVSTRKSSVSRRGRVYKSRRNWLKRFLDGKVNRRKKDGMFLGRTSKRNND